MNKNCISKKNDLWWFHDYVKWRAQVLNLFGLKFQSDMIEEYSAISKGIVEKTKEELKDLFN